MDPAPARPSRRRLPASQRRALIEDAAAAVFADRGYEASLEEVAKVVGVTRPVIYDHFPTKSHLHEALLTRHTDELLDFVEERVGAAVPDAEARLEAGFSAFFEFVESHPSAWRMLFRDPPQDPAVARAHQETQRRATRLLAGLMASHMGNVAQHVGDRVEMLAEFLKNGMNGLAGWWYEHRELDRAEMVRIAMDFAWLGVERLLQGERRRQA